MKLICGITTKNEEWIIKKTLSILTKFCDKIIILDDNSTDKTEEICNSFKKVQFIKRIKRKNIWNREEAKGLYKLFLNCSKYNPDYILFLDADEIPTPNFTNFFNNINKNIEAWSIRMINLQKDEKHYRIDNFITKLGTIINHNPFLNNGWRKTVLLKYNKNKKYTYNLKIQKGGTSKYHPLPQNLNNVQNTENIYIIHYGKLNKTYINGEKDNFYALIESNDKKETYKQRLLHHYLCRTGSGPNGPIYKKCPKEWFWK